LQRECLPLSHLTSAQDKVPEIPVDIIPAQREYVCIGVDNYSQMTKLLRQQAILELARQNHIGSQEELQIILAKRGLEVGQATLSRDIRELALVKTVHGYKLPNGNGQHAEAGLPPVHRLVREFVQDVRPAQNLIVLKTVVGSAQPVAAALDAQNWPEVVGTIAGDDAILIVSPDNRAAKKLGERIRGMLA
jgi:transcriptional regulator of arginine metabolism